MQIHPLKTYRATAGLTQAQLAAAIGVARETLARWEVGLALPDPALLATIEAKTGIPGKELRPDLAAAMGIPPNSNGEAA